MKRIFIIIILLQMIIFSAQVKATYSDAYLTGYLQSIFVHNFFLPPDSIKIKKGEIYIYQDRLGHYNIEQIKDKVTQSLQSLNVDKKVHLVENNTLLAGENNSIYTNSEPIEVDGILPHQGLFQPLIADPKWPRFTLAYQYHTKNKILRQAFAPNFGATFTLYRKSLDKEDKEWDVSIQAGLFGIMDIGSNPTALVNADYFVGLPLSYRSGAFSLLLRPYHISTHLGDEFMLTPEGKKTTRINLSYEGIDLILSYNINSLRIYGGGGYIVHKDPSYIKPLKMQAGVEYYADTTFFNGRLRPVTGLDIKADQNGKWVPGISFKTGVQIENSSLLGNKVQIMLEYYKGKSMHGQFYNNSIQSIGIGLHGYL